ncbi:unnamed protein product [Diatraea saccharalis]|uniref:Uncharacterized protein n=1 Tax=Diatraea saccharalis TaxID=40085 RepID=A0A9N9R563_9NEOP|nr:unnamed protein product [Diatraea saccharalis]
MAPKIATTKKAENTETSAHHSQRIEEKIRSKEKEMEIKGWGEMKKLSMELYHSMNKATATSSVKGQVMEDAKKMMSKINELSERLSKTDEEGEMDRIQYIQLLQSSDKSNLTDYIKIKEICRQQYVEVMEESQKMRNLVEEKIIDILTQIVEGKRVGELIKKDQTAVKGHLEEVKQNINQIKSKENKDKEEQKVQMKEIWENIQRINETITEINKEKKESKGIDYEKLINTCKKNEKANIKLQEKIEEIGKITKEIKDDNKKGKDIMEEIINTQKEAIKASQWEDMGTKKKEFTYAEKLKSRKEEQPRTTYHSIIVNSTDENKTGEEVFNEIRKTAEGKEEWCEVVKVKKAKNRKVIISCTKEEEARKLKQTLEINNKLKIENAKNKNPLIIIKNIKGENKTEQAIEAVRRKIERMGKRKDQHKEEIEKAYEKKTRNPHMSSVVLRVDPQTWQQLTEAGSATTMGILRRGRSVPAYPVLLLFGLRPQQTVLQGAAGQMLPLWRGPPVRGL